MIHCGSLVYRWRGAVENRIIGFSWFAQQVPDMATETGPHASDIPLKPLKTGPEGELDQERFSALTRVYGQSVAATLPSLHIAVVGIGGVGSWAAEALARNGIGTITLIDPDDITASNINRQCHALTETLGRSKVDVMRERIHSINPACECHAIDDMLVENNLQQHISTRLDYVIDAIDSIRFKAALIHYCRRRKIKIVTTGGAGGRVDPLQVGVADLSKTWNDALAAKVRSRLRSNYGFSRNPKRRFSVDCVFSSEQARYPADGGEISLAKPGIPGATLDCDQGYGSVGAVTSVFGLVAASLAINKALERREKVPPAG